MYIAAVLTVTIKKHESSHYIHYNKFQKDYIYDIISINGLLPTNAFNIELIDLPPILL